jgi:hypothetical protein
MTKAMDKSSLDVSKFGNKLSFESETQNLTPFDFMRIVFQFTADQGTHKLNASCSLIAPDLSFSFTQIPKLKLVSTPLSRLLIGKLRPEDEKSIQTNFKGDGS